MKKHLPNTLTILNLLCGVMACISALDANPVVAAYYIAAGAFFDLFDGALARKLGVDNALGKQMDSLADMVTFGLAPAFIARELIFKGVYLHSGDITMNGTELLLTYAPFILIVCAALRLARFNIDEEQTSEFKGLPTPANALFWLSIPLFPHTSEGLGALAHYLENPWVIAVLCLIMGLLMVSRIRLFSLKVAKGTKGQSTWQIILIASALLLIVLFKFSALPLIILLYLLLSVIRNITTHEVQS